ncbi:MAG: NAD(P)-dependent oxidoreductase [Planctomycetota bacterium]
MIVLVADKLDAAALEKLRGTGCDVHVDPTLGPDTIAAEAERIAAQILVVRSTKVPASVFGADTSLRLVIRAGAGYDNIDCVAASSAGVSVSNCPGMNAVAVAELAMGHLINCDRRLVDQAADLRDGRWDKAGYAKARGLKGRTLGVVGVGAVGQEVVIRARAFGMNVKAWSRRMTPVRAIELGVEAAKPGREGLLEMLSGCDAVSISVASTPETESMVDREFLAALPEGAYLVNTSRGKVVDESALAWAVRERGLRAGLDVYRDQPAQKTCAWEQPLACLGGVWGTHHCGASTDQAQVAVGQCVVEIVREFAATGSVLHRVAGPADTVNA